MQLYCFKNILVKYCLKGYNIQRGVLDEIQQKWTIKNDGLYIDDEKILPKSYKVGDKYDNCTITSVNLDQDNTQIITVEKNMPDFTIVYTLKQGLGVIKYTKLNNANQIPSIAFFNDYFKIFFLEQRKNQIIC